MNINKQPPLPPDRDEDGFLNIHSVFRTIQGEGPFAGFPAVFVRLYGCNLQCPHCDTEYTDNREPHNALAIVRICEAELLGYRGGNPVKTKPLVVITGGEPFRQNITPLVTALLERDIYVQIETNGVLYPDYDFPWGDELLTVVCSPKTPRIHKQTALSVHAYKYVLSYDSVAEDGLPKSALGHPLGKYDHVARPPSEWSGPIYINPMDAQDPEVNEKNMEAVVKTVMTHRNAIMGVQMHKIVGLP